MMTPSTHLFSLTYLLIALVTSSSCLPTGEHQESDQVQDTLLGIVRDLESVVVALRHYAVHTEQQQQQPAVESVFESLRSDKSTTDNNNDDNDLSLKEALEFIVSLAKENKQRRRDHDIPFPFGVPANKLE
jgi:hypothetical protein